MSIDGEDNDPFQLVRLAKELEDRESDDAPNFRDDASENKAQFPEFLPLSHINVHLKAKDFNIENFLLSLCYVSLPDLCFELRKYLAELKQSLFKLINDEYEAFISLSTDLKDEGNRLCNLKSPLGALTIQVLDSRRELESVKKMIQEKLRIRLIMREENALLQLLLRVSDSVARLESLLLIPPPEDNVALIPGSPLGFSETIGLGVTGNRCRVHSSKLLFQAASEYVQVLYHAKKAKNEHCIFYNVVEWRIERIHSTISSDLDHVFATILTKSPHGNLDRRVLESDVAANLSECLRTYHILGLWRDAEEVLKREVVQTFVKKEIYRGTLTASHSPIIPHTPSKFMHITPSPPLTPYTPMASFILCQDFGTTRDFSSSVSLYSRFLEDTDDPLARLLMQVLRFIERNFSCIMEIAESISRESFIAASLPQKELMRYDHDISILSNSHRFDILANVIWNEFGTALMDELGSHIFSSGQPQEFKKNFEITQAFIHSLESLAPSLESLLAMQRHDVFENFQMRWQLSVYFQMRCKEITTKLEAQLAAPGIFLSSTQGTFTSMQASSVWSAILTCWNPDILIPHLSHKFWKLTLQILSRFKKWLERDMQFVQLEFDSLMRSVVDKSTNRSAAPVSATSAEQILAEDALLREYSFLILDIMTMRRDILLLWQERIWASLPTGLDNDFLLESLQCAMSGLASLIIPMSEQILKILSRRCSDALLPVRSIPSQFRAMTIKHGPREPSYFIPYILRPLKDFFGIESSGGPGRLLVNEYLELYANQIFDTVVQKYIQYLSAMRKTEESLRRLKKGKKAHFSLFGSAGICEEDREDARIQSQLLLDIEAFCKDAESFGIVPDSFDNFNNLKHIVRNMEVEES